MSINIVFHIDKSINKYNQGAYFKYIRSHFIFPIYFNVKNTFKIETLVL